MTRHQEVYNEDCALHVPSSLVQLERVVVCVVKLVDVICVMIVVLLIAHVDVVAVYVQFSYPFFCSGDVLFTLTCHHLSTRLPSL